VLELNKDEKTRGIIREAETKAEAAFFDRRLFVVAKLIPSSINCILVCGISTVEKRGLYFLSHVLCVLV
jgi:hypothetical protein